MVRGTQEQMRSGDKYAALEEVVSLSLILFPFNDKIEVKSGIGSISLELCFCQSLFKEDVGFALLC